VIFLTAVDFAAALQEVPMVEPVVRDEGWRRFPRAAVKELLRKVPLFVGCPNQDDFIDAIAQLCSDELRDGHLGFPSLAAGCTLRQQC